MVPMTSSSNANFPNIRLRRFRKSAGLREIFSETRLSASELVMPFFVTHGKNIRKPIEPMPGQFQFSVDQLLIEIKEITALGIRSVLLFGLPKDKDLQGSEAFASDGIIQQAVSAIKSHDTDIVVITDVCLCEYTDHGHCGVLNDAGVDNDATLDLLGKIAVSHAKSGADIVAPSAMMDGQVGHIRKALDDAGHNQAGIMAYAAKAFSSFYGPFREAAGSSPKQGDRRAYQMNGGNIRESMREMELDVAEGADLLLVKPALAYLDVISNAKKSFILPIASYNVSGEYAMLKAAGANGWINEKSAIQEIMTSLKRAGSDLIITYFAKDLALILKEGLDE